jgi:hypothetical protein
MLPLAFNSEGDPFDVPATTVGWRIKRYQPGRGAPEMVYSSGGLPLVIPIEAGIDELRRAVVTPGKYRLDPVDDHHRVVRDTDTAVVFVQERKPEPPTANARPRASRPVDADPNANAMLIESMRLSVEALRINAEIARKVASRFGVMVEAAASLIRAADGAALPGPQAIHAEHDGSEDHKADDNDDRQAHVRDDNENEPGACPPIPPSGLDGNALIAQLATVLLGSRQPAPEAAPAAPEAPPPSEAPASEPSVSSPGNQPQESPAVATETKTPPPAGPHPIPPSASWTSVQPHNAPSLPPDAPVFTARPNVSASMSSAAPSLAAYADAPAATAPSPLASIPATPPLASTTKAPDATRPPSVPLANANTDAASRPTKADVPRNASAMPAAARSSPQMVWVAQETESSGFPFRTSTATPPAPTISPPPPTPISSARRRSSASAMGSPPRVHDDDIGLQFTPTDVEPPPLSEDVVLHFAAILRALRRNEAAHVSAAAGELSLHDLRTWLEDLSLMTVPEAVAYVRELIAGSNRLRSVS